jgi:hypothetical protein
MGLNSRYPQAASNYNPHLEVPCEEENHGSYSTFQMGSTKGFVTAYYGRIGYRLITRLSVMKYKIRQRL